MEGMKKRCVHKSVFVFILNSENFVLAKRPADHRGRKELDHTGQHGDQRESTVGRIR